MTTLICTIEIEDDDSLTIPRETLRALGLKPGDRLEVSITPLATPEEKTEGATEQTLVDLLGDTIGAVEGNGGCSRDA